MLRILVADYGCYLKWFAVLAFLVWDSLADSPTDVICNGGINPYHTPISTEIITVPAGSSVTTEWHHTLDGANAADAADPIDASHKGPVMTYL